MRLIVDQSGCTRIEDHVDYAVFYQEASKNVNYMTFKSYVNREVSPLTLSLPKFLNIDLAEEEAFLLAAMLTKKITKLRREMRQAEEGLINDDLKRQRYVTTTLLLRIKQHPYMVEANLKREKDAN